MEPENNTRIPNKKRGRPRTLTGYKRLKAICGARNGADMIGSCMRLHPEHSAAWLQCADKREISMTALAYLARFSHERQVELFDTFRTLGARGAKRYVECLTRPPTPEQIAERILNWIGHEFPSVACEKVGEGLEIAAVSVKTAAERHRRRP